jgi:DNA-directed RNA polymerase subunit RPC12/RpoP
MDITKELALKCPRSHDMIRLTTTDIYRCITCPAEWTGTTIRSYPWCEKDEQPCFPFGVQTNNVAQAFVCPMCNESKRLVRNQPKSDS